MATRWRIAILLAVITTINYIDRSVFGVVAPVVRDQFGINDADYGLITSGFLLAYGVGQLISGPLIDRLGTKRAFELAVVFWSAATVLHALGRGVWSFFTMRVVLGLAEAANFPAASKAVAQWFPANERCHSGGYFHVGRGLGCHYHAATDRLDYANAELAVGLHYPGFARIDLGILWRRWYHLPESHPTLDEAERTLILAQRSEQQSGVGWTQLLGYRQFWGILVARIVSDFPFYSFCFGCHSTSLMCEVLTSELSPYSPGYPGCSLT